MSLFKINKNISKPLFYYVNCCVLHLQKSTFHNIKKESNTWLRHKQEMIYRPWLFNLTKSNLRNSRSASFNHNFQRNFSTSEEPTSDVPSYYDRYIFPEPPDLVSDEEHDIVIEKVNEVISNPKRGRLFAVVSVAANQYKITDNDLIKTSGKMVGAKIGDRIRLEKVLLVGGEDFTLVGRPLVRRSLVKVEATVVELTPGVEKVIQYFRRGDSFERRYFYTPYYTILRINSIQAFPELS